MKKITILAVAFLFMLPDIVSATVFSMSAPSFMYSPNRMSESTRSVTDLIVVAPEGNKLKFDRSGITFSLNKEPFQYDNAPADMVICDNGEVYLQAPFFSYAQPTYIVGHKDGDKVIFDLPQTVVDEDYGGGYVVQLNATLGQFDEKSSSFVPVNSDKSAELNFPEVENKLVMSVDENGVYRYESGLKVEDGMLSVDNGDIILCMCDANDGSWFGPAEVDITLKPFEGKLVSPPIDLVTEPMGFTYNGTGHMVNVGFDGDDVYIKGIVADYPDSWIKGVLNDGMVSIPSEQYLGENFRHAAFVYFSTAELDKISGLMTFLDSSDFYYDAESKTLTGPKNVVGLYNGALDYVHYIEMYEDMMIRPQIENPEILLNPPYNITYNEEPYPVVEFSFSTLNEEGYMLNNNNLYYKMYVDGEEYTFLPEEYSIDTDMTYVPVAFTNYYTFLSDNCRNTIYLNFIGFDTIGFRLCYVEVGEDGEPKEVIAESEIATYAESVVETVRDEMYTSYDSIYYDMMGRRVIHPAKGDLLIKQYGKKRYKVIF